MDKQPILSLCIPTNGAVEWILPVIESIYSQGYDNEKFEVVITDNGKDSPLPAHIANMNYPNLRYKQTTDEGFLNLVSCLKEGKGLFCKMINHRSVMLPGSIFQMVSLIEKYKDSQPIIYCASGNCNMSGDILECKNTDAFVSSLSYWCSWSGGIGFWQRDILRLGEIELNEMFPNASLLFGVRINASYVIWNKVFQNMESDAGKGGYDLFYTFGVVFLDIINELRTQMRITSKTFIFVKRDLYHFLCDLYLNEVILPTKHTFIIKNIKESLSIYYGIYCYRKMVLMGYMKAFWRCLKWGLLKPFKLLGSN